MDEAIDQQLPGLLKTYEQLHRAPELSYQEAKTAAFLAGRLRKLGYKVTEKVGRYWTKDLISHGLVATLGHGKGPTVLVRTDMDALPVREQTGLAYASTATKVDETGAEVHLMHACGHDMHMSIFLGVAAILAQMKEQWRGTLMLVAQPAEERGAGARAMLEDRLYQRFARPDFALALHLASDMPAGSVGYHGGYALANVDSIDIVVKGVGGHGAYPHTAKDPVVAAAQLVLGLQTVVSRQVSPLAPSVITVGSIHGGTKHNVIPEEVRLQLTVRSYEMAVRETLISGIRRTAQGIAASAGLPKPTVTLHDQEHTPAAYNNPALVERVVKVWSKELGAANVVHRDPVMGGEDFGRYSLEDHSVPGFIFWLGTQDAKGLAKLVKQGKSPPSLHSNKFAPLPEPTLRAGLRAMTLAALELLSAR